MVFSAKANNNRNSLYECGTCIEVGLVDGEVRNVGGCAGSHPDVDHRLVGIAVSDMVVADQWAVGHSQKQPLVARHVVEAIFRAGGRNGEESKGSVFAAIGGQAVAQEAGDMEALTAGLGREAIGQDGGGSGTVVKAHMAVVHSVDEERRRCYVRTVPVSRRV